MKRPRRRFDESVGRLTLPEFSVERIESSYCPLKVPRSRATGSCLSLERQLIGSLCDYKKTFPQSFDFINHAFVQDLVTIVVKLEKDAKELNCHSEELTQHLAKERLVLQKTRRDLQKTKQMACIALAEPVTLTQQQKQELIGSGYGTKSGNKTFHRHAAMVIKRIEALAKDDPLKQFELAQVVFHRLSAELALDLIRPAKALF